MNYYEILEVSPNASQEIIKIAYKNLAKKYHPDTSNQENAAEIMQRINEAYEVLSNPAKREEYDESLNIKNEYEHTNQSPNSVKNIKEILSKVARTYPNILDSDDIYYNNSDNIDNTYFIKKCEDYIDIDEDCKIYILYFGTTSSSNSSSKLHNIMALTENGILAFSELYDGWAKSISWEEFKNRGVKRDGDEIVIGSYRFKCTSAGDLYSLLKEIERLLINGYVAQTEDEEINETLIKKVKHTLPTFIIYIGAMIFFYFKGWNNWIVKILDVLLIGALCVYISDMICLFVKNTTAKTVIKCLVYGVGALVWYKITR